MFFFIEMKSGSYEMLSSNLLIGINRIHCAWLVAVWGITWKWDRRLINREIETFGYNATRFCFREARLFCLRTVCSLLRCLSSCAYLFSTSAKPRHFFKHAQHSCLLSTPLLRRRRRPIFDNPTAICFTAPISLSHVSLKCITLPFLLAINVVL